MSSTLPRISVITPTYNQADFIEETILSVLEQKYPNLEYLVYDGGSTDGTLEILKKYEQHLRWVSRKDKGQSDALNQGFRQASGEILAYINSDDRYEPGALLRVGAHMRDHPQVHWLTGRCRLIDPAGKEIRRLITAYKNFWLLFGSYASLLVLDYVSQPATFWRRSVIEKVGFFDEDLHLTMDYDYSLRVGQHFKLHTVPATLAAFRVHPAAKSSLVREHFDEDLAIARRYTASRLLGALHSAHNEIIIKTYERSSHQAAPKDAAL